MAATAILNSQKVQFWIAVTFAWPISICKSNLMHTGRELAQLYLFVYFQEATVRHL